MNLIACRLVAREFSPASARPSSAASTWLRSHDLSFAKARKQRRCQWRRWSHAARMQLKGYTTGGFDRGAPLWKEMLWVAVKCLIFQTAVPWPSALRVTLLRIFGARIGERVVVRANVNITFPWRLTVGDDVWFGDDVVVLSLAPVVIESSVCISQRAFLCTGSHAFQSATFDLLVKPIFVRSGSWIAAQAFIAPGVEVGADSLVSAGSVVFAAVPPRTMVQGNPAQVVKTFGTP